MQAGFWNKFMDLIEDLNLTCVPPLLQLFEILMWDWSY